MQTLITSLNREEVLRYLGYQGTRIPDHLNHLVDQCMAKTLDCIAPRYLYRRFALEHLPQGIGLSGTGLVFSGASLQEHLKNCREAFLLCATVGGEMDRLIRRSMIASPDEGVILDSCASAAIEALADLAEGELSAIAAGEGLNLTWRFSPGYGDWPITCQRDILELLDAHRKIGLSVNPSMLLTPCKSVTAIVGLSDTRRDPRPNKCDFCNNRSHCPFRKRGTQC